MPCLPDKSKLMESGGRNKKLKTGFAGTLTRGTYGKEGNFKSHLEIFRMFQFKERKKERVEDTCTQDSFGISWIRFSLSDFQHRLTSIYFVSNWIF